jgi:hypothetical protein
VTSQPAQVVPLERYVDARELSELMGVSTTTIKRFVAAGMPSETWGMEPHAPLPAVASDGVGA